MEARFHISAVSIVGGQAWPSSEAGLVGTILGLETISCCSELSLTSDMAAILMSLTMALSTSSHSEEDKDVGCSNSTLGLAVGLFLAEEVMCLAPILVSAFSEQAPLLVKPAAPSFSDEGVFVDGASGSSDDRALTAFVERAEVLRPYLLGLNEELGRENSVERAMIREVVGCDLEGGTSLG